MSAGVSYAGMAFNFEIMKNLFCLCILLLIGSMQMSRASDKIEKQPLKVLYVGGSADIQVLNETISAKALPIGQRHSGRCSDSISRL